MFRDAKEELARLERELLAAEQADADATADALLEEYLDEEDADVLGLFRDDRPDARDPADTDFDDIDFEDMDFGDDREMVYQNYSNDYGRKPHYSAYNSDRTDEDLDVYSDNVYQGGKDNVRGLLITALVLLGGIFAVLLFWVFRYLM